VATRYLLPCRCGEKTAIETSQAGQQVRCRCGAALEVPTLRKIMAMEPLEPGPGAATATAWGTRERVALLGVTGLVLALALVVVLMFQRPTMPRYPDPQSLTPAQSLILWQQLQQIGPDIGGLPPQVEYRTQIASWWRWLILDGVLAGAGLITLAIALLLPTAKGTTR
jgi:hypothetical protein